MAFVQDDGAVRVFSVVLVAKPSTRAREATTHTHTQTQDRRKHHRRKYRGHEGNALHVFADVLLRVARAAESPAGQTLASNARTPPTRPRTRAGAGPNSWRTPTPCSKAPRRGGKSRLPVTRRPAHTPRCHRSQPPRRAPHAWEPGVTSLQLMRPMHEARSTSLRNIQPMPGRDKSMHTP